MNNSTIVFLINDEVRAICAIYETGDNAPREIFKTLDMTVKVGDFVVVESPARHGLSVVKVVEVDVELDIDTATQIKWVVSVVDESGHKSNLEAESEAIRTVQNAERERRKNELRKQIFADQESKIGSLKLANHSSAQVIEPPSAPGK
jgi:hypothetical protein